jgi:hypothetical protein
LLWAGARVLFLLVVAFGSAGPDLRLADPTLPPRSSPLFGPAAFFWVVALTAVLLLLDVRVVRETILFANLGVSHAHLLRLALPVVCALELIAQITFAAISAS